MKVDRNMPSYGALAITIPAVPVGPETLRIAGADVVEGDVFQVLTVDGPKHYQVKSIISGAEKA